MVVEGLVGNGGEPSDPGEGEIGIGSPPSAGSATLVPEARMALVSLATRPTTWRDETAIVLKTTRKQKIRFGSVARGEAARFRLFRR